jgi:hypothetical protein
MQMKKWIVTGIVVATVLNLRAQAPEMFRYQGRLVDGTNLVNATVPMSFKLYDALSGGTQLYEDSNSVLVVDGLYSTTIGDNTVYGSLANTLTNVAVYLELTVNGETLSPRERLVSVPYALNAGGNTAPSGTIILSATYPDPQLETQGYSVVKNESGQDWQFVGTCSAGYLGRIISFSGKMWSFGESAWNSNDGVQWQCANTNIGVEIGQAVVFNNKIWALRTALPTTFFNDIWRSDNGTNWVLVAANLPWRPRTGAALAVFDNKLWLMGGCYHNGDFQFIQLNDVWSSDNGVEWTLITTNAAWRKRHSASAFEFKGKLWITGGIDGVVMNDIWWSANGSDWVRSALLPQDCRSACVVDDKICISGNYTKKTVPYTDYGYCLITSPDGAVWQFGGALSWNKNTDGEYPCLFVHNNALWSIGRETARLNLIKQDNGLYYYRKD